MAGFYLHGEDLVPGSVGPFETQADALAHLELFWKQRGDAALSHPCWVDEIPDPDNNCTPEEDRAFEGRDYLSW